MQRLLIFIYVAFFFLLGCEKDEIRATLNADGLPAMITNTSDELSIVITDETLQEDVTFQWNETEYGVNTEVSYTLEIDAACNNFASPIVIGATTDHALDLTQEALNTKLLNDLKLAQHLPAELQIRVTSKVNGGFLKTSEPVTFTMTPYSVWSKGLWLLGDDWTDATAPVIYAKSASVYEGYVYLNKDHAFKFADTRICDKTLFGGVEGALSTEASANELAVGTTGYYRVIADVENLTYEFTLIETFGMIGTSTPGGWSTSSALTYNEGSQSWEGNIDLTAGALKFRANNGWSINYGPADGNALTGKLLLDDPGSISIQKSGNYTVVIDFSKKKSPDFTYTVTKNAADQVPATLWLPGEYQGWSPSTAPTIKAINSSTFEGYVYISSPTGYKFTDAPDWNHTNYGDSGTPNVLTTDGSAGGLGLSQAGVYKFNVNVNTLAYSAVLINSMGMVGPATFNGSDDGWNQSVAMNYDQVNDLWSATINLAPGALKFRANNEWAINYGPADGNSLSGTLIFDDPGSISIAEAGSYTVTVDFSRSESPYKYTYSIVKN